MAPGAEKEESGDEATNQARPSDAEAEVAVGPRRVLRLLAEAAAVVFFYVIAVVAFMWPVVREPLDHVRLTHNALERADQNLVIWILSWNWHAFVSNPLAIFDANIFHPALGTLAGAEHMFGVMPLYGPLYAMSGNPVFALNVTHVLTLALCGAAMYALLRHWGVVRAGALFGGFIYALYPGQVHGGAMIQMLSRQYLPLALIFLDQTLRSGRARSACGFALFLIWQMLCSVYLAFITAISLSAYTLVILVWCRRDISLRGVGLLFGAVCVSAAAIALIHFPYLDFWSVGVIPDHTANDIVPAFSSDFWRNWLFPPIALREWGVDLFTGTPSYLGVIPILAAGCALVWPRRESASWAAPASLAIFVAGYVFALGPWREVFGHRVTLPFGLLADWVPGFSSMRVPSRFEVAAMTGLSALAGIGFGRALKAGEGQSRSKWLVVAALALLLVGTAIEYDLPFDRPTARQIPVGEHIPPVYHALAELPDGPLLELPWFGAISWRRPEISSQYMRYSTYHWNRLLNGYTGYEPPSAALIGALTRALPDERATELLVRTSGLRYVLVHTSMLPFSARSQWKTIPAGFKLVARFDSDLLLEVAEPIEPDLMEAMRDGPRAGHTILGTPVEKLPRSGRRAHLRFTIAPPADVEPHRPIFVKVEVSNPTRRPWPAMAGGTTDTVALSYRFTRIDSVDEPALPPSQGRLGPLPYDLLPGEKVPVEHWIFTPDRAGDYTLEVGVEQEGEWFRGLVARRPIRVARP